ncbi:hypothetical protein [Nonomuraea sp. CA-141351]|uniref:hypothetical protein n=1 Tax=Nonomuraea sp. CA-141351 TaxID=3239996 RepID=UPI003D89FF96
MTIDSSRSPSGAPTATARDIRERHRDEHRQHGIPKQHHSHQRQEPRHPEHARDAAQGGVTLTNPTGSPPPAETR